MNPHTPTAGTRRPATSAWLAGHLLGEAGAGRGVALIDYSGELARAVLDRLPAEHSTGRPAHGGDTTTTPPTRPAGTRRPATSTWLVDHLLDAATTGRGVVLIDQSGELARAVLDRFPAEPRTGWPAHGGEDR